MVPLPGGLSSHQVPGNREWTGGGWGRGTAGTGFQFCRSDCFWYFTKMANTQRYWTVPTEDNQNSSSAEGRALL